jgi:hypothetical protein
MNKIQLVTLCAAMLCGLSQAALVGHWDFEGSTAQNKATTGSAYDGTLVGVAAYSTTDTAFAGSTAALDLSAVGYAAMFVNNTAADGLFNTTDLTISYWLKMETSEKAEVDGWVTIASKGLEDGSGWVNRRQGPGGNILRIGADSDVGTTTLAIDGTWHHVAMSITGGTTLNGYVDGVKVIDTLAVSYTADTAKNLLFGAQREDGYRSINGLMDELQYYDNVLTDGEVATLAIPEPSTLGLISAAALGLFGIRRFRI